MATLHTENFPEFRILPIVFGVFSFFSLLLFFIGRRLGVAILLLFYTVFILISAVDFYRWNYQYGHNLDPNAAIKVPGMAYQPPLIGYKQLLNFGAYSVPDTGGWLLIAALVLLCFIVAKEFRMFQKKQ